MAVGRGKIVCVSVAYIILGASMAFCGAFQIILHLRYLWLDSIHAGVWVGIWMIVTGIMGIIASFNKCATSFIFVFLVFSIISTLLGLEIVIYYTYTGAAHWSVYWSSRNYLIIASVTCFFAVVEIINGICAVNVSLLLRRNVRRIHAAAQVEMWEWSDWLELPRTDVRKENKLGEGQFGVVYRGMVKIGSEWRPCAVKILLENATPSGDRDSLLDEVRMMVSVGYHPNIVSLIGACTKDGPILLVLRLAENGSLKDYLARHPISTEDKIKIARDVANGMLHLSNKWCVHRDLAARNVLLDSNNVAMVSDFGLTRNKGQSGSYQQRSNEAVPFRHMAIESLGYSKYSTASDVWSFGVVMWEIESGGHVPYSNMPSSDEVLAFLRNGMRLAQPDGCSNEMYEIMEQCWKKHDLERPTFGKLSKLLEEQLQNVTRASNPVNDAGQVNEDRMPENARYQQPKDQTNQDSEASSNRPAPVNDAGPASGASSNRPTQVNDAGPASNPVNDAGQVNKDRGTAKLEYQRPRNQTSQASGASSNRTAPVNDAGQVNKDIKALYQRRKDQTSQASGASSNRPTQVNDAGPEKQASNPVNDAGHASGASSNQTCPSE